VKSFVSRVVFLSGKKGEWKYVKEVTENFRYDGDY